MTKMRLTLLIGIFLFNCAFSQTKDIAHTYQIKGNNECAIDIGKIQISKKTKNKFSFKIVVNNKTGYEGYVDGNAFFVSSNKAVYKSKDCGSITFFFKPNDILQIIEMDCSYNHGANICFSGNYVKY